MRKEKFLKLMFLVTVFGKSVLSSDHDLWSSDKFKNFKESCESYKGKPWSVEEQGSNYIIYNAGQESMTKKRHYFIKKLISIWQGSVGSLFAVYSDQNTVDCRFFDESVRTKHIGIQRILDQDDNNKITLGQFEDMLSNTVPVRMISRCSSEERSTKSPSVSFEQAEASQKVSLQRQQQAKLAGSRRQRE